MRRCFLIAAAWLSALPCCAQIQIASEFQLGDKVEAVWTADPPKDGEFKYEWTPDPPCPVEVVDGGKRLLLWPRSGDYKLLGKATLTYKGDVLPPYFDRVTFKVIGSDGPAPTKTLRDLAGADAPAIGSRLAALSASVKSGDAPAALFASVFKLSVAPWDGNAAIPVIEKRLAKLTTADAIAGELDRIVAELGTVKPTDPVTPVDPSKPLAATYIHEKDDTPVPSSVRVALNRLNRERNIVATEFEDDTEDGDGDVPDQYRVPLEAARKNGLPSFVVNSGERILNIVKSPTTEAAVMEAVP